MVVLTGWLFASSCSPPRLSATQFLSATKGQLPLRSALSPNCWCLLVGLAAASPPPRAFVGGPPPLQAQPRRWGHRRYKVGRCDNSGERTRPALPRVQFPTSRRKTVFGEHSEPRCRVTALRRGTRLFTRRQRAAHADAEHHTRGRVSSPECSLQPTG